MDYSNDDFDADIMKELNMLANEEGVTFDWNKALPTAAEKQKKKAENKTLSEIDLESISKIGQIDVTNIELNEEDLQDPLLKAQLQELGLEDDGHSIQYSLENAEKLNLEQSSILQNLGLGDLDQIEQMQLNDADLDDPDLAGQMSELEASSEPDEEKEEAASIVSTATLYAEAEKKKREAVMAKKEGNIDRALVLLREAKALEQQAKVSGNLDNACILADSGQVTSLKKVTPVEPPGTSVPAISPEQPPMLGHTSSTDAQILALKQQALQLKKEGDIQGAMNVLRQAKQKELLQKSRSLKLSPSNSPEPQSNEALAQFQKAATEAYNMYLQRAKAMLEEDKKAYAAETYKKAKAMKEHLSKIPQYKALGGSPPPSRWESTKTARIKRRDDIGEDEIEVSILQLSAGIPIQKNKAVFVSYSIPMSKDVVISAQTKDRTFKGQDIQFEFSQKHPINRKSRATSLAVGAKKAVFEVRQKKMFGMMSPAFVGKCAVELNPLLTKCELLATVPLNGENSRRAVGGNLQVKLSLRTPLQADEVEQIETREFIVGEWPDLPSPAVPQKADLPSGVGKDEGKSTKGDTVSQEELMDPMNPKFLVSNDVLEQEIEALNQQYKGQEMPVDILIRQSLLQTQLDLLVRSVQDETLTMPDYIERITTRIKKDKLLAVQLSRCDKKQQAVMVLRRIKVMESELSSIPDQNDEDNS